jgi:IS30 family transposase
MDQVRELCRQNCTLAEVAAVIGCSHDTIERRIKELYDQTFAEYFAEHFVYGHASIRRAQFKLGVEKLDGPMLKHLGKNYLGQTDKMDTTIKHSGAIQTTNTTMEDVKKVMSNPKTAKLAEELAYAIAEMDIDKESKDGEDK